MADSPQVRLRPEEIAAVKRIVAEHLGPAAEVRVFGSRADPAKRGGDLDLHVLVPGTAPDWPELMEKIAVLPSVVEFREVVRLRNRLSHV